MKITLSEWLKIDKLRKAATDAVAALENDLRMSAITYAHNKDKDEANLLLELAAKVNVGNLEFDTYPQSEWMGGPTSGPGSEKTKTYIREPHCVGLTRRHFTALEVARAKRYGLLKGGDDLTGPGEGEVVDFSSLANGDKFYFPLTRMAPVYYKTGVKEYVQKNAAGEVVGTFVAKESKVVKVID